MAVRAGDRFKLLRFLAAPRSYYGKPVACTFKECVKFMGTSPWHVRMLLYSLIGSGHVDPVEVKVSDAGCTVVADAEGERSSQGDQEAAA